MKTGVWDKLVARGSLRVWWEYQNVDMLFLQMGTLLLKNLTELNKDSTWAGPVVDGFIMERGSAQPSLNFFCVQH